MSTMRNPRNFPIAALPAAAACGLLALGLVLSGQASAPAWHSPARAAKLANPVPASPESVALGQKLYGKQCQSCHGAKGLGDGPQAKDLEKKPTSITDDKLCKQSDGELFWKLTEGKKPMPAFEKLTTPEERWR